MNVVTSALSFLVKCDDLRRIFTLGVAAHCTVIHLDILYILN